MVAVDGNVKRSVQLLDAAVPALRTVNDRQKPPAHVESLLTVAASTAPLGAGVGVATCTGACQPPPAVASNTHISTPLGHGSLALVPLARTTAAWAPSGVMSTAACPPKNSDAVSTFAISTGS